MAITKRTELKEEILPNQTIQIRTTTVIEEDGAELARIITVMSFTLATTSAVKHKKSKILLLLYGHKK